MVAPSATVALDEPIVTFFFLWLTVSGVWISVASANGFAGPNGFTGHTPFTLWSSITNCGVYEKTSYGLTPMLSLPDTPRRVTSCAKLTFAVAVRLLESVCVMLDRTVCLLYPVFVMVPLSYLASPDRKYWVFPVIPLMLASVSYANWLLPNNWLW